MNNRRNAFGTLLLARHGETEWNLTGRIMGHKDSQVTAKGLSKIRICADMLKNHGVSRIVSSPLGRAALSACLYSEILSIPLYFNPNLCELSAGAWQGKFRRELSSDDRPFRATWSDRPPNGESYADAEDRAALFLQAMLSYHRDSVLVIGHAGINKVILKIRLNLKPDDAIKLMFPHEFIYRIDPSDQVMLLDPDNSDGKIISLNPCHGA